MKKLLWFIGGMVFVGAAMWLFKVPEGLEWWRLALGGAATCLACICMEHVVERERACDRS